MINLPTEKVYCSECQRVLAKNSYMYHYVWIDPDGQQVDQGWYPIGPECRKDVIRRGFEVARLGDIDN